jgi:hypothetical protein
MIAILVAAVMASHPGLTVQVNTLVVPIQPLSAVCEREYRTTQEGRSAARSARYESPVNLPRLFRFRKVRWRRPGITR